MTAVHDNDSFFDLDGEQENHKANSPFLVKGGYDRGKSSTPEAVLRATRNKSLTPSTSGNFSAKSSDSIMSNKKAVKSYRYDDSPSPTRSLSRTPARSRSRSPSPYRNQSPAYSDSFNSEDSDQDSRKASPTRNERSGKPKGRGRGNSMDTSSRFNSGTSQDSRSTFKSHGGSSNYGKNNNRNKKASQKAPPKKPAANNTKRSNSIASSQPSPRSTDVAKRMLSAKGHTISRLRNEFNQLQKEHDEMVRENKLLKQLQRRQERALSKYDSEESELPQMLKKHSAELDSMRRRIRKYQERDKDKDRRLKDKDEQYIQTRDELKQIRSLAEDKGLLERHDLQKRINRLEEKLEKRDKTVRDLEHYVDNIKKNQRHELHERQAKEQDLMGQIQKLEMENERFQMQLREKEKELEIRNIYSNRLIKPPNKLRQGVSPNNLKPLMMNKATSTADQPKVPRPPSEKQQRVLSAEEVKRREEMSARVKSPKDVGKEKEKTETEQQERTLSGRDHGRKPEESKELSEHEKILRDLDMGWKKGATEEADARRRQDDERRKREAEERERKKREEDQQHKELEEMQRREEEERQKRREEEVAAKRKQEMEENEKERKKNEETHTKRDNSSDEDEDNVPYFGSKQTDAPKPATKSPPYAVNSVRDLHKYSRGDNNDLKGRDESNDADKQKEADRLAEERRKKDLLLARMRDIDDGNKPDSGRSRKSYNFTKPVENLHNGMPSHPDVTSNANQDKKTNEMTFGGYAPTFTSTKVQPKPKKKSFFDDDDDDDGDDGKVELFSNSKPAASQNKANKNTDLMANLFGNQPDEEKVPKSSFNDDKNMFTSSTKAKPVSYSWEKKVDVGRGSNADHGSPSGGLFSNGHTDKAPLGSKGPMNMSHDSLDDIDDLEEVII